MIELAFWSFACLVLYAYVGYPCALMAIALVRRRPVIRAAITPRVSFIITAHNEEARIQEKLDNTLAQDYPRDQFQIIVASDCSTDATDDIVGSYESRVRLVRAPVRRGKEAAQQLAVESASGAVLIFSDVATALAPDAVSTIVMNFADATVGCVSSIDRFVNADGQTSGEGAYVRYEMLLRTLETRVNSLVGLSGSFFAARREVCRRWASDRQSDFSTLLAAVDLGWRGVLDPRCPGYYRNIADDRRELERKIRTVVRGLFVLRANAHMLNPFRYGLFAWQLASHKLCRWLVPFAMIAAYVTNAMLAAGSLFYQALFVVHTLAYIVAVAGLWLEIKALKIPAFLLQANLAVFIAWLRHLRGDRITVWTPSDRVRKLPQAG
jgi:cellulose synthase/poly-beta-1,6-N-acetylglucosamine synthase-like glycosyltransferase